MSLPADCALSASGASVCSVLGAVSSPSFFSEPPQAVMVAAKPNIKNKAIILERITSLLIKYKTTQISVQAFR